MLAVLCAAAAWQFQTGNLIETIPSLRPLSSEGMSVVGPPNLPSLEFRYDIVIEDADGRNFRLESLRDLNAAHERFPKLAAQYPGTRLLLRNRLTRDILAQTDGF